MIYVMSDIHGNSRRFDSVMEKIDLQAEDTLYVLGDVVDRHGDGVRIIRRLMAMPNVKMLLGNHEYMMLRAIDDPFEPESVKRLDEWRFHWYRNGGEVTHKYWKRIRKTLRAEVVAYLKSLPTSFDVQVGGRSYKLVHGAPVECYDPNDRYPTPTHFSVWKRWELGDKLPGDYTMVFGHTPTKYYASHNPLQVYFGERLIGIDCGSGFPDTPEDAFDPQGRLACLRLDDLQVFYSDEETE